MIFFFCSCVVTHRWKFVSRSITPISFSFEAHILVHLKSIDDVRSGMRLPSADHFFFAASLQNGFNWSIDRYRHAHPGVLNVMMRMTMTARACIHKWGLSALFFYCWITFYLIGFIYICLMGCGGIFNDYYMARLIDSASAHNLCLAVNDRRILMVGSY